MKVLCLMAAVFSAVDSSSFHLHPSSSMNRSLRGGQMRLADHPGTMTMEELWRYFDSNTETGLSEREAKERLKRYGPNQLEEPPKQSLWELILEQFQDRLVQILVVVAVLSGVFSLVEFRSDEDAILWKAFVEPGVIVAILVLNAIVGVWQSRSAQDSLAALESLQASTCTVLRSSQVVPDLPSSELVPGDVIQVRVGDKVPADCRLIKISTSVMNVDEGSLTGESTTVSKIPGSEGTVKSKVLQDQIGMLYSGTVVTAGSGQALVTQTGMKTEFGKIQSGVMTAMGDLQKTPLAIKLDEFGEQLTVIIGVICIAVWLVSIPKMNDPTFNSFFEGAVYYAKVAVALGVAAIPEGLPAVITLCLSLGTRKMAKRNVIVRSLPSVETLGCTSVICTDKTGTLTTNEMTAVSLVMLEKKGGQSVACEHEIEGVSYSPIGRIDGVDEDINKHPAGALADVAAVSALCNDAKIIGRSAESSKKDTKEYERMGEPTEAALCVLAEKIGGMVETRSTEPSILASANTDRWRSMYAKLATLEFTRDRKSMSVLCNFPRGRRNSGNRLLVKGAPNLLLERCTHIKYRDGRVVRLRGKLRREVEARVSELATRPLRCLALAVKESNHLERSLRRVDPKKVDISRHPLLSKSENFKNVESGLTLVGIVGIKDPARPGVAESIEICSKAGIRVFMITGDAKDTAVAIARDVKIFPSAETQRGKPIKAYEGREFFVKPEKEQIKLLKEGNIVFCRAEPADKQKLVKMLQSLGEIVAMTGDGVNDAPALKQAAIGVAMGITGTEVSKEAADMILADDNFSTIVNAVEEGRRIYGNMQAFICFLISCNIGEICAIFFATLAGFPEPLTAMHLLWVNLVTDGPPATALGFNPPAPDLMDVPPRPSDEPIMTKWLLTRYILTGLYVGLATIGIFAQHYLDQGITLAQLATWSQCGEFWTPDGGASMCTELFQGSGRMLPQTLALTTLVCMEMLKALSAISVDTSLLRISPLSNKWLLLGVSGPLLLHLFVVYSSEFGLGALGESFGLVPLSHDNWVAVLSWALPILLLDECLKAIGRWINYNKEEVPDFLLEKA